ECLLILPVVPHDPVFVGHIQGRSMPGGKGYHIVFPDAEMAVPGFHVVRECHETSSPIRSTASCMRPVDRVRANRTYPSPPDPNPTPGVTTIPASSRSRVANCMQSSTSIHT